MADKTHRDCAKLSLSETFALAEGDGGVDCRVERDVTVAAWLSILADPLESCILTPDSSEAIEARV